MRAILMIQQEVMDTVTRQCPQTTTFFKRKESRSGIEPEVLPLTSLTPYRRPNRLTNDDDDCFYTALSSRLTTHACDSTT